MRLNLLNILIRTLLLANCLNKGGQNLFGFDADGLSTYQEILTYGTNTNQKDSNTDSIANGQAVALGYSPAFNLSAVIDHLQSNPPSGLYTDSQMRAMAFGDFVLTKSAKIQR
jgi:hypothetical protein